MIISKGINAFNDNSHKFVVIDEGIFCTLSSYDNDMIIDLVNEYRNGKRSLSFISKNDSKYNRYKQLAKNENILN